MSALATVIKSPPLRVMGVAMALLGALNASIYPYQSLIAIEKIGLSKPDFALVLVTASVVAVCTSVLLGILSDQHANRRMTAVVTSIAGTVGIGLMLLMPGPVSFVLCHGILVPVASSLFGQMFALVGLASQNAGAARDGIQAVIRSSLSAAFLLMLMFWTFAFGAGLGVMTIYISAGVASLALTVLILRHWPRDGQTDWDDTPSGMNIVQALREIAHPFVAFRLGCMGAIGASGVLYMVLISLVFEASPIRDTSDVALYVGMVAGWEVPFMLLLPRLIGRGSRSAQIAVGAAIYVCHLVLLPFLSDSPLIWVMPMVAGLGGAAILTLPIAYYQDLLAGRPGTAASLMALQKLVADVLCAGAFAVGTALGGYELVALIGTAMALTGALGLYLADRTGWLREENA